MPAQLYCTGAMHVFAGGMISSGALPGGQTAFPISYLGTCQLAPDIQIHRLQREAQNDIGGDVGIDMSYMGQMAHLSFDLTRWDEAIYRDVIASFPHQTAAAIGANGVDVLGDIGTFMITEGRAVEVQILFPYALKAAFNVGVSNMPAGYRFFATFPTGDRMPPDGGGTKPRKLNVQAIAKPVYDPTTGALRLYDHNVALALALASGPL